MTNPEKQRLTLLVDEQRNVREIRVDPKFFSRGALKKILQYQVFRSDMQTEVIIAKRDVVFHSAESLRRVKDLSRISQDEFFNAAASVMLIAGEIIIRRDTQKSL